MSNPTKKKRILVNWDYERDDHVEPFHSISNDIDFFFIKKKYSTEISQKLSKFKILFWAEYSSPYQLLDMIKPDKVVFSGLESYYEISLNIACRNLNIKTYFLQHGAANEILSFYKNNWIEKEPLKSQIRNESITKKMHATFFYFKALKFKNVSFFLKFVEYYIRRRFSSNYMSILEKVQFGYRKPNYYIECTYYNASWIKERDKINNDRIIPIGVFSLDKYFSKNHNEPIIKENYFLLIDSPLELLPSLNISLTDHKKVYECLNNLAKQNSCKLLIKLHPKSYHLTFPEFDSNIIFIKNQSIEDVLFKVQFTFCFFSTLALAAIYYTNCYMIKLGDNNSVQKELEKLQVVNIISISDLRTPKTQIILKNVAKNNLDKFVEQFLYKTDGKATERLKNILLN
jgi:hypothetical protein